MALPFDVRLLAGDAHAGGADRLPHLLGQDPVGFRAQRGIVGDDLADLGLVVGPLSWLPAQRGRVRLAVRSVTAGGTRPCDAGSARP